ncbi:Alpha/beta hydrolase family-domain-containing protein [Stachybotrys elegans]|uniref:Alpha/beta hydrolase family-domain-containing protein n=1 Tax=Stachybotrys elegans TaxID=80388 RepID=A0A8K0WQ84_9HYPO|nr:Alpha/beta hydrolase family-domain-containing protein [Stachybotrys elegans]
MASTFLIKEHVIPASHIREYARATSTDQNAALSLHVKEYVPRDNLDPRDGDVSVVSAHANGFPKEVYEPLWEEFYALAKQEGIRIRAIWIADAAWQGQSGVLNKGLLGNDPSWLDYARDILHMINTMRMPRPLISIGHSFGANALANVALMHPRLFLCQIQLDPTISSFAATPGALEQSPAAKSANRRDAWPSREAAAQAFKSRSFYKRWDPRALEAWIQYGLRPVGDDVNGPVTLTTSRDQEVFTYLRPSWEAYDEEGQTLINPEKAPDLDPSLNDRYPQFPFYRPEGASTIKRLPNLRPDTLYHFGADSELSPEELMKQKMELTGVGIGGSGGAPKGLVLRLVTEKTGHLVPLEAPRVCAQAAVSFLGKCLGRNEKRENEYVEWTKKPLEEKTTVSDEYKKRLTQPPKTKL